MNHTDNVQNYEARLEFNKELAQITEDNIPLYHAIGNLVDGKPTKAILACLSAILADVCEELCDDVDELHLCFFTKSVGDFIHDSAHLIRRDKEAKKNLN